MNNLELEKRAYVLSKMIQSTKKIYDDPKIDEKQRGLLETLVGAGIWYLPSGTELFSGKISQAALEELNINSTVHLVEEHFYPRKISGKMCYTKFYKQIEADPQAFLNLYRQTFGRYHLVLKSENNLLKKFQKSSGFISPDDSYRAAEISLVKLTRDHVLKYPESLRKYEKYFMTSSIK